MTARFRSALAGCDVPWVELTGPYRIRLETAIHACDALLASGWGLASPLPPATDAGR